MLVLILLTGFFFPLGGVAISCWAYHRTRRAIPSSLGIAWSMSVVFYFYRTTDDHDVFRHIEWLANYEGVPLSSALDAGHYTGLYVWDLVCWLVAQTGNPYLLQASVTFVAYLIIAYVILDYGNQVQASTHLVLSAVALTVCSIPILPIVSGMRNSLAVLMCAWAVYREVVHHARRATSLLVFLGALMIHRSVIVILAIWLVFPMLRRLSRTTALLIFALSASVAALAPVMLGYLQGGSGILSLVLAETLTDSVDATTVNEWSRAQAASFNTRVNNVMSLVMILLILARVISLRGKLQPSGISTVQRVSSSEARRSGKKRAHRGSPWIYPVDEFQVQRARMAGDQRGISLDSGSGVRLFSYFIVLSSLTLGLMTSFTVEGNRLLSAVYLLGFAVYLGARHSVSSNLSLGDVLIGAVAIVLLALHIYSLVYGLEPEMVDKMIKAAIFTPLSLDS